MDIEQEIVHIVREQQKSMGIASVEKDADGNYIAYGDAESHSVSGPAVNLSRLARELAKLLK